MIRDSDEGQVGLGKVDFEALQAKRTEAERLRAAIESKLNQMVAANLTRVDFKEKFEELIAKYNAGAANVETFFRELMVSTTNWMMRTNAQ